MTLYVDTGQATVKDAVWIFLNTLLMSTHIRNGSEVDHDETHKLVEAAPSIRAHFMSSIYHDGPKAVPEDSHKRSHSELLDCDIGEWSSWDCSPPFRS